MNCRQVEAKLADWSAENLPEPTCAEIQAHLRSCPDCAQCWAIFEETLTVTSTSSQPLLSAEKSQAMWQCCERHIQQKKVSDLSASKSNVRESSTRNSGAWWQISPRFGWAALAGACAIFGIAWLTPQKTLNPANESSSTPPTIRIAQNVPSGQEEWIRFSLPPAQASSFINHHTTMAFDPFADHVASTLISDAATSLPNDNAARATTVADVSATSN